MLESWKSFLHFHIATTLHNLALNYILTLLPNCLTQQDSHSLQSKGPLLPPLPRPQWLDSVLVALMSINICGANLILKKKNHRKRSKAMWQLACSIDGAGWVLFSVNHSLIISTAVYRCARVLAWHWVKSFQTASWPNKETGRLCCWKLLLKGTC